jgi:tRNA pseudouridine38-40 synthase
MFMKTGQNFKLTIEYDGTPFHGWQRQKNNRTVQEEIEKALKIMTCGHVTLRGASRTDAGVHALGQVANFFCDTRLDSETLLKGLNKLTHDAIVIIDCQRVANTFSAQFDAQSKVYRYRILNRQMPCAIGRQYAWYYNRTLDLAAMRRALAHIIGLHDFKAFEGAGSPRAHSIRHVLNAVITRQADGYIVFEIEGVGFLKHMVRNIVGTLVYVGLGRLTSDDVRTIRLSKDRKQAGLNAPAHGLFLVKIRYGG